MTKNSPVGTSECPIKGCVETVDVFKYKAATEDSARRRFAGRLYCQCPIHGRIENQEFLLEHIKWAEEKNAPVAPVAAPVTPEPASPVPPVKAAPVAPAPTPVPPVKKSEDWSFFR